ncbi:MAG: hypothetical protein ABWZ78_01550 [Burkholderiaceae bacterium]
MKVKAFLILMVVTVVTVVLAAKLAERWFAPGFERGIVIGVIAALVVFPLTRWFERLGWVKGAWSPGGAVGKQAASPQWSELDTPGPTVDPNTDTRAGTSTGSTTGAGTGTGSTAGAGTGTGTSTSTEPAAPSDPIDGPGRSGPSAVTSATTADVRDNRSPTGDAR